MTFKYFIQKSHLLYARSRKSDIFFPETSETETSGYLLIGFIGLFVVGIIAVLIDYWRKRRREQASDPQTGFRAWHNDRRRYYRINESLRAQFRLAYREWPCEITDISEGGVAFSSKLGPDKLKPGTILKNISFFLDGTEIVTNAVVRRIRPLKGKGLDGVYRCAAEFVYINNRDKTRIVQLIYSKQRAMIRRIRADDEETVD